MKLKEKIFAFWNKLRGTDQKAEVKKLSVHQRNTSTSHLHTALDEVVKNQKISDEIVKENTFKKSWDADADAIYIFLHQHDFISEDLKIKLSDLNCLEYFQSLVNNGSKI